MSRYKNALRFQGPSGWFMECAILSLTDFWRAFIVDLKMRKEITLIVQEKDRRSFRQNETSPQAIILSRLSTCQRLTMNHH